jgi:hypothetical protein
MPDDTEATTTQTLDAEALDRLGDALSCFARFTVERGRDHLGEFLDVVDRDYPGIRERVRISDALFVCRSGFLGVAHDVPSASVALIRIIPPDA